MSNRITKDAEYERPQLDEFSAEFVFAFSDPYCMSGLNFVKNVYTMSMIFAWYFPGNRMHISVNRISEADYCNKQILEAFKNRNWNGIGNEKPYRYVAPTHH